MELCCAWHRLRESSNWSLSGAVYRGGNWDCLEGELELGNDREEQVRLMFPIHSLCRRMVCWRADGEDRGGGALKEGVLHFLQ